MKKLMTLAAAGLMIAGLASCKKDHTCTCTASAFGISTSASTTIKDTKKKAKEACEGKSATANGVTTTCELK